MLLKDAPYDLLVMGKRICPRDLPVSTLLLCSILSRAASSHLAVSCQQSAPVTVAPGIVLKRSSLLTSETLISALEAFVSAAKKLPREDVYDVVEGYIKISVECAEIFQLLSGEKRPESEVCSSLPSLMGRRKS